MSANPTSATSASRPDRRPDRRRDRTRDALLRAGRTLFAQRDVDAVSIDEIVNLADVAKGSFYNHFQDKDAFAREIGAEVRRKVEAQISAVTADVDDAALHVALALCVFARFATRSRDAARVLYKLNDGSTMTQAPINRNMGEVMARGLASGRFRGIDLECGILVIMGLTVITVRHVLEERLATPPAQIGRDMAQAMLRSLGVSLPQARSLATRASVRIFENGAAETGALNGA
ncbi:MULTISPECIES: TetR/AcrR family transcriptional regulator [unclassified Luteimonas]